jgi:HAD superfamily hydrolase (TIGR01450 family)
LENLHVEDVDAVLVDYDIQFNYYKLSYASICIDKGARYFATNEDHFWKIGERLLPGTGSIISAIKTVTLRDPIVLGKPNGFAIDLIEKSHNLDRKTTLMVGDKIESDVLFGKNAGIDTCLVLTGTTDECALQNEASKSEPILPKYVCKDLSL